MGNSFKENLKEILEYKDMTVKELAFLTGISNRSIGNYLNSRESMPPADYACKIAKALNTTIEYLLTGKNSENPTQIFSKSLNSIITNFPKLSQEDQVLVSQLTESLSKKNKPSLYKI